MDELCRGSNLQTSFIKLSLQGTTFVFASGDYGVASNPLSGSGNGCIGQKQRERNYGLRRHSL